MIGDPLAMALLEGKYGDGVAVTVDVAAGTAAPGPQAPAAGGLVLR
jgi:hypothetical protein